jgi:(3R)-3-hydroxyacyl-CoA dehydrogenase / 3a,7a,12a-trihydroxy-5b-cholest-24-enoyl-CoA hydratase / enoyl-CoA hydratase 2
MSLLRFDGKVAVITGAGAGLGKSHALIFASRGAKVVVNDLGGAFTGGGASARAADAVVDEIKAAGGIAVANYDSVTDGAKIIETAIKNFSRVDILVNNAGILRDTSFHKMTKEDWDLIFKVHVEGAFACTHAAWPYMREQNYGRVIFTSSAAGLYGNFGQVNYSAAKLGLVGFSNSLALEGAKKNIFSNAIAPVAASRMTETILPPEVLANLKPEYVTPLVAYLSHESSTENGGIFEVGAGFFGKLRWERSTGKTFKLGRAITPETVATVFSEICDFKTSTHPANVMDALTPLLSNVSSQSKGGNEFIDVDLALGAKMPEATSSYDERDLALYALGVGAGAQKPRDEHELKLVYERNSDGFQALPTFGVVPAVNAIFALAAEGKTAPGLNYGLDRILHGEQFTEIVKTLPPKAKLKHQAHISEIFDKGKHAIVVTHIDTFDAETNQLLVKNDLSMVVRGAGGWGGERGPSSDVNVPPSRAPDAVIVEKTSDNQALLYRLSGDWNPLHVDPEFAKLFGFEKPILHGLCTYGYVGRAVVSAFLGGDVRKFKNIKVRFADSVFPGETLKIEMWKESDLRILVKATVVERNVVCISNAAVEFYAEIPTAKGSATEVKQINIPATPSASATEAIFEGIGTYVAQHPELLKQVGHVYQFNITNPDSAWILDLKNGNGSVKAGSADTADCTLKLLDSDWLAMSSGQADPQKLFTTGKLKITGNVMASQKLEFLKKIAPSEATPIRSEKLPASAEIAVSVHGPKVLAKLKGNQIALNAPLNFRVKNTNFQFSVGQGVAEGSNGNAVSTVTLPDDTFIELSKGTSVKSLYQMGLLKVDGDLNAVRNLDFFKGTL